MGRRVMRPLPLGLALLVCVGCGGDEAPAPDADALDLGDAPDTAAPSDPDLGAALDLGPDTAFDLGLDPDAHPESDAAPDAGLELDAASPLCARGIEATLDGEPIDALAFAPTAARGPARDVTVTLTNTCGHPVRFLGHPDGWIDDPRFTLAALPPVLLEPGASTAIGLRFHPTEAGEAYAQLALPYDAPGAPLVLDLVAPVERARRVVFIGDGRHVVTVDDYGETVVADTFETLQAHGDALQRGVAWGAGHYVAVGGNVDARWWVSADGVEWTAYDDPDLGVMGGVAYGDGHFVAIGSTPRSSLDGHAWTAGQGARTGINTGHLRHIRYGDGLFVAFGDDGHVVTTADRDGWQSDVNLDTGALRAGAFGGGRWVLVGEAGAVAVSTDGAESWAISRVPEAGGLSGLVYTDGAFFASDGARVFRSADGLAWGTVNAADFSVSVGYGRLLIGTRGREIGRSDDGGFSWSLLYTSPDGLPIGAAAVEGL